MPNCHSRKVYLCVRCDLTCAVNLILKLSIKKRTSDIIEYIDENMPFELMEHANAALMETFPIKSKEKYNRVYKNFKKWQVSHDVASINTVWINYGIFSCSTRKKLKTKEPFDSMLIATLRGNKHIFIRKNFQVTSFLKMDVKVSKIYQTYRIFN